MAATIAQRKKFSKCPFCGVVVVSGKNLGGFSLYEDGRSDLICNKPACVGRFREELEE